VIALSLLFIPAGATVQHLATLRRQLRFGWIAALDIGTQLAITAVSVLLAIYGFSYWSLVAGTTAGAFTGLVIAWWGSGWAPRLPRRGTGIRPLLRFGGYTAASNFLYVISKDLDKMLLGRVWGTDAVGVYSRAHQLTMLPTYTFSGAIGRSVLPGMAGSVESPEEFRRVYLTNTSLLAILAMPTAALCLVAADFIVPLLLGQQWLEAIPVFRALAVAALAHPIASTNAWLYGSLGRGLANLVWIAANVPLLILSIVIGIKWGPIGVAISYSVYLLVTVLPCMIFALRGTPVRLIDLWPVARTPILLSIAVGAGGAVPLLSAASFSPLVGTMVATFCGGLAALAVAVVLPSARRDAIDALGALGIFRGLRRFRPPLPG
jgi:PST family polysaccharide transporter